MNKKHIKILLTGNNDSGMKELTELFQSANVSRKFELLTDTDFSLNDILNEQTQKNTALPNLIVINDINKKSNTINKLNTIKSNKTLKTIPVIIITNNTITNDIKDAYTKGVNCYIVTPENKNDLYRKIEYLIEFWFDVARLP